ncbi:lysozyme inhibitor LprI family protein [Achromobacter sp. B7]|uniref:lysozyme inhibitor LprI family protein n=1 Tax=Achromobacter sp. B7 TaxID=2282475 RepID=UPI001F09B964|nr:lysozyme inhibitor LprI family protein [Achromobacter sp. B7]
MTQPHSTRPPAYAPKTRYTPAMKLLFTLGLATLWASAQAASFDCNKAAGITERLICSDVETSALDGKLQGAYETALAATDAYGKKELGKEQRNWIKYARDICQDSACLQQAYTTRIAMLARNEEHIANGEVYSDCKLPGNQTVSGECVNVVSIRDPNSRVESFNQSLAHQKQNGRIIGCSRLIDLPVGAAGSNHSFGGSCVLQEGTQRKNVRICNDDMFGHFQVEPSTPQDASDKRLVDFIYAQCYGG